MDLEMTKTTTTSSWRTWTGAHFDNIGKIPCFVFANEYLVDVNGDPIAEDHPEIAAEIGRRGKDYQDHAYGEVPVIGCDHDPDVTSDRDALIKMHQYDELVFGGFICVHCTPLHLEDPDLNVAWPCPPLREAGVTDEEAVELIKARRAAIKAAAASREIVTTLNEPYEEANRRAWANITRPADTDPVWDAVDED
jgi:hypothetical protein